MVRRRSTVRFRKGARRVPGQRHDHKIQLRPVESVVESVRVPGHGRVMATTTKGHIELLAGGSYRVYVFAGTDPVTGKKRCLRRTVKTEP
jgi:hypothetical protein